VRFTLGGVVGVNTLRLAGLLSFETKLQLVTTIQGARVVQYKVEGAFNEPYVNGRHIS